MRESRKVGKVRREPSGRDLVGMQRPARINRSRDPGEFIRFAAASLKAARVSFASRSSRCCGGDRGTHAGARIADPAYSHTQRIAKGPMRKREKYTANIGERGKEREGERDGADVKVESTNRDMPAYTSMLCSSGDRKEPDLARVRTLLYREP